MAGGDMKPGQLAFPQAIPFVDEIGLELWGYGKGECDLRVDLAARHFNTWQVAHGGVLMTLLDVAMAIAARSGYGGEAATSESTPIWDLGPGVATVEMKTSFMRPGEGTLFARGKLLHRAATLAFCEASVHDDTGALCAHATGTFKYMRALPTRSRTFKTLPDAASAVGESERVK